MWELSFISERQKELLVKMGIYIFIIKTQGSTNLMGRIPCILGRKLKQHLSGTCISKLWRKTNYIKLYLKLGYIRHHLGSSPALGLIRIRGAGLDSSTPLDLLNPLINFVCHIRSVCA